MVSRPRVFYGMTHTEKTTIQEFLTKMIRRVPNFPARLATLLRKRYGLEGNKPHTLREIGKEFGVTRERVRQLEAIILHMLRKHCKKHGIDSPLL